MTSLQVWTTILGLLVLIAGGVIGLSKWNQRRIDRRVLDYLEKRARKHSDGSRSRSLADITQALGVPEKLVGGPYSTPESRQGKDARGELGSHLMADWHCERHSRLLMTLSSCSVRALVVSKFVPAAVLAAGCCIGLSLKLDPPRRVRM